jgi:hypothetical protein
MRFEPDRHGGERSIVAVDVKPQDREAITQLGFRMDGDVFRWKFPEGASHFEAVVENWKRDGTQMVRRLPRG